MRGSSAIVAGAALAAVSVVNATPAKIQARASSTTSGSTPTVTVSGNAFWAGTDRFYVRGVDYQPGGSSELADPLADESTCTRDIPYFQQLGINTVRVYTVDNTANHDACMKALQNAGIYVALDVNTPYYSLNRASPAESYNAVYLQSVFATMDAFADYENTLLFFSGNEVINMDNTTNAAPYVKAVTRDMKTYRTSRGMREIPIGYSAADVSTNRYDLASYMNCGTDDQRSDFFAFNDYSWCDPSTYTTSGWSTNVATFGNYSIPLFLSEYGCITNTRVFDEVAALYNTEMTGVYSGGLVYEYSEEGSGYGLVSISGSTVTTTTGFTDLKNMLAANMAPSGGGGYAANNSASTCPTKSTTWQVTEFTGDELPAIPSAAVKYFKTGAGTGPGLSTTGSQTDGDSASSGTATPGSGSATATYATASSTASGTSSATTGTSTAKGDASRLMGEMSFAPVVTVGVAALFSLVGAALL